jgi:uncharacterized protein
LALVLAALVVAVLLPDDDKAPIPAPVTVEVDQPQKPPVATASGRVVDFEEVSEGHNLQAPKDGNVAIHNGYPESGIALIIDNVGYDMVALKRLLKLPFPVAISILPDAPGAAEAAMHAYESGNVVMLHLPMEPTTPKYRKRMGPSFLRMDMDQSQVRQKFIKALEQVPYVTGVNNHMGSLLTTLEAPMGWVMDVCKEHSLFFIDSKTSHSSVAADVAAKSGIAWGARRIFLDHTVDAESLRLAWGSALRCAEEKGSCIVIGHPHAETLDFLEHQVRSEDHRLIRPVTSMLHAEGVL